MNAGDLKERITLKRFNETTRVWDELENATVWAAAEPQGDAVYRFRIRYRDDLKSKADLAPAMRALYRGEELDLTDAIEADRRTETHLIASRRIIEEIDDLAAGIRGIKAWP